MSEFRKGKYIGENHHMFGKKFTEEHKQKISEANKGKVFSEETKKKISEASKGENNSNWKYSKTNKERQEERNYRRYTIWRSNVFKRDNYTCQKCRDSKGGNLISHHIYSYAKYKILRITVANGITLCKSCHKDFHKKFGFGKNNRKQLDEFLKNKSK